MLGILLVLSAFCNSGAPILASLFFIMHYTHLLGISYYVNFLGHLGSNGFQLKQRFGTHSNWKNQNPGGRFGATS